jgi:hypothetical protein
MYRRIGCAALAVVCYVAQPRSGHAADPAGACLASLAPGSTDPVLRDVHFHLTQTGSLIVVTGCVASNSGDGLHGVAASVGIFGKDGVLINQAGQSYVNVSPLNNPDASGPKLLLMFATSLDVDLKYERQFSPETVVTLASTTCTKPLPQCDAGPARTTTMRLPVQIDQDVAKAGQ